MQRDPNRPRRVGEVLKRELAELIRQQLDHPDAMSITLTATDVSPDLRSAKFFVTCLKGEQQAIEMVKVLNQASGFLRHCLRGRVDLRGLPNLRFVYDESVERGRRISALIDEVAPDSADKNDSD